MRKKKENDEVRKNRKTSSRRKGRSRGLDLDRLK